MTSSQSNFILGVVATTLLIVCALYLIGLAAVNAKREACTKFADITGQQTTFITYGLTDSLFKELEACRATLTQANSDISRLRIYLAQGAEL